LQLYVAPISQISRDATKVKKVVLKKFIRETILIAKKDLTIERSTGEIVTATGFFAVLLVVLSSRAFWTYTAEFDALLAPGVIWLSVTFASVLGLSRSWTREREEGALRGLVVAPLSRGAIFAGKAIGVLVFITAIELLVVPTAAVLLGFDLWKYIG